MKLLDMGRFQNICLDIDKNDSIVKLLDTGHLLYLNNLVILRANFI